MLADKRVRLPAELHGIVKTDATGDGGLSTGVLNIEDAMRQKTKRMPMRAEIGSRNRSCCRKRGSRVAP